MGPVLAAEMGYLPGMLWILAGVVFAGAVQDFVVLFVSTRRDGRSLGDLVKSEMGSVPGLMLVVLSAVYYGVRTACSARRSATPTDRETPFEPLLAQALQSR